MTEPTYETTFNPAKEILAPIDRGLHEFNLAHLGKEMIERYARVAVIATDESGEVVGGIYGELCWDWLHIDTLWVDAERRTQGIGSQLLQRIEHAAVSKGFYGSHLETTDFQALEFYQENGYEVFGELEGKPRGSTWYYMKKDLPPEG